MNLELFSTDLLNRLLLTLALLLGGAGLYWLTGRLVLARARTPAKSLKTHRREAPTLLYFTTPTCAPCKTVQRPAIQRLQQELGERLQVIEIDAAARPEVADQWGVMSVPTTFIIDPAGSPRHVNHGVASAEKLMHQVKDLL